MKIIRNVFLWICLGIFQINSISAQTVRANADVKCLTPPLEMGYSLGGYGARMSKPAEGIHDDIWAKALVVDDGIKKYAIVTLDILGLPPNVKPQVVEKINREGWTEENILFLPSHTHTSLEMFALNDKNIYKMAPIGIFQPKLLEFVVETLAELIISTDRNLQPVMIGTSNTQIDGLNRNRRGAPFVDNYLTVSRIDLYNGLPLAVMVNWTAHPTIMDDEDMWVSGGWPGYLQRELEAWIGHDIVAMYYNGAEGDQSVIADGAGSRYEKAEKYGRKLAIEVMDIYEDIKPSKEIELDYNYQVIQLPGRKPHPGFMKTGGSEYGLDEGTIQSLLEQVLPAETSIGAYQLGDLMIVGAPGEMIAELGLEIEEKLRKHGITYPVIGGLANQWVSYILTEEEYEKSGYEASVSFYGKDLGDVIVTGMLDTSISIYK
jgi:hypothetical protein